MNQIILLLIGNKAVGKSTSFNYLKEIYPDIVEVQLAKKLKDVCADVFKVPREHFDLQEFKEQPFENTIDLDIFSVKKIFNAYGLPHISLPDMKKHQGKQLSTPRQIAQYVGTEILRSILINIHCDNAIKEINNQGIYCVTDVRFPNELAYFKQKFKFNLYPIYVENEMAEKKALSDNHPSECHIPSLRPFCVKLDNNGTFAQLKENVEMMFKTILMDNSFTNSLSFNDDFKFD